MTENLITMTEKAAEKAKEFMKEDKDAPEYLRVYVQGGGCSGLSYGMGFEKNKDEEDIVIEQYGIKLLVDPCSLDSLKGTELDYIEGLNEAGFKFNNPNVTKNCSCGSSFSTE